MNSEQKQLAHYSIIEEIGRGGMGVVYRAKDLKLNRIVALKVIVGSNAQSTFVQRFMREAKIMAKLKHPNIINILDVGFINHYYFFAMDYIPGYSLGEIIKNKRLSTRKVINILISVCETVQFAHKNGVVHRDLKPANIMLKNNQNPIVMDFGIALSHDESIQLSSSRSIMGTLNYMSPEQLQGIRKHIDKQTDVYALGAIMHKLLVGQPPFLGNSAQLVKKILYEKPIPLHSIKNSIDKHLSYICLKAIEKDKKKRYQTSQKMADDLIAFSQGKKINVPNRRFFTSNFAIFKKNLLIFFFIVFSFCLGLYSAKPSNKNIMPQYWNKDLWGNCWNGSFLDFTNSSWKSLSEKEKKKKARTYQIWYSQKLGIDHKINWKWFYTSLPMVLVPPGKFLMASSKKEITIFHPFYICKYEITRKQWQDVMLSDISKNPKKKLAQPITNVSWQKTKEFCSKLNIELPNEVEWEYACFAGSIIAFATSNTKPSVIKNINESELYNAWGCYGMLENAKEWCLDYIKNKQNKRIYLIRGKTRGFSLRPKKDLGFRPILSLLAFTKKKETYVAEQARKN